MSEVVLNNSPVRTSNNYKMNNIIIDIAKINFDKNFDSIRYEDFDNDNIKITKETSSIDVTYPIGLEEEIQNNSNVKLKIDMIGNSSKENIISFIFDENNARLIDDIEIVVRENVKSKLVIKYVASKDLNQNEVGFHNGLIRTRIGQNASLKVTVINLLDENTNSVLKMDNVLEQNSILNYNVVDFGGNSSVTNYYANLIGDDSENNVNTIYLGKSNQLFDMNYIAETKGKKTKVIMDAQGALKDIAKKHFKGTIDFKRGCEKAEGSENEFCMLLSDEAKSISLPMLLCDEEDVVGNHSSAAGKVQSRELFYIMSRGFTEKEAKTMLVKARFQKVIDNITSEKIRNEILQEIDNRIS